MKFKECESYATIHPSKATTCYPYGLIGLYGYFYLLTISANLWWAGRKTEVNLIYWITCSVRRVIAILAKNGIKVEDDEATVIVDFLYLMAKNHKKAGEENASKPQGEIEL